MELHDTYKTDTSNTQQFFLYPAEEVLHHFDIGCAQIMAAANLEGTVEFLATTMYFLNECNGGSLQLKDDSNYYRMVKYNGDGEVFHAAGRYGVDGDYGEQPQRFNLFSERYLATCQISAALNYIRPALTSVLQNHAGITHQVGRTT